MNRINLNSIRRLVSYSRTKSILEANKCVLFMNGTLAKPEVNIFMSKELLPQAFLKPNISVVLPEQ